MADEKLNTGPAENTSPEAAGPITTPEQAAASEPRQEHTGPTIPEPGDVVVSFDKINELMAEKRQNARAEVEKAETPETPEAAAPGETPQPANTEEPKKPRRGRPPTSGSESICDNKPFAFKDNSLFRKWWLLITVYPVFRSTLKTAIFPHFLSWYAWTIRKPFSAVLVLQYALCRFRVCKAAWHKGFCPSICPCWRAFSASFCRGNRDTL